MSWGQNGTGQNGTDKMSRTKCPRKKSREKTQTKKCAVKMSPLLFARPASKTWTKPGSNKRFGRLRRARRGPPRFSIQLWSQFSRVIDKLPRSNNAIEGWHNAFNNVVGFAHPSTTKLARKLQQEQHSTQLLRRQLELGTTAGRKKKTYIRVNEALHAMVTDYNNRDPITYLGDIARVLNINVVWLH